jgi:hypothetical protein
MGDKRIFWATKSIEILGPSKWDNIPEFDISNLHIYENLPEPPSQQHKQTGAGEQGCDGRVVAGKLILPVAKAIR